MSEVVARAKDLPAIYNAGIQALVKALQIDRASILLFDPDGVIRFKAWHGLSDRYRAAVEGHSPWKPGDEASPRPITVRAVRTDDSLAAFRDPITNEGIISVAFIPLVGPRGLLGKFMLYCDQPHDFTDDDIELAGAIAHHIAFAIERTRSDLDLAASQRELKDFVESAPIGMHWIGPDGIITWANRAELEMLGYAAEDFIGHHVSEFYHDQPATQDMLERMDQNEELIDYEACLRCKDGSIRHVLVSSNVHRKDGRFVHTRCFTRDVTYRKHMEQEREQLLQRERSARMYVEKVNRLKDEFLATLSHELRTPLQAILGWSRLLLSERLDPDQVRRAAEIMERNASIQARLIDDLLDMSRIISGKISLNVRKVDLSEVVLGALETVTPAAEGKQIEIATSIDPTLPPLLGDQERLQQVTWNLLSNAIKFTPRGGRIDVVLRRDVDYLELSVHDSGEGIPAEFLPYVFERFLQADASTTRKQGGLGLGLAIVRNLVELHGGLVRAESSGPGLGATFRVYLPVPVRSVEHVPAASRPSTTARSKKSRADLSGVRILLVDDESDARDLVRFVLEDSGAEVKATGSVSEALSTLSRWKPNVVVSDIAMPDEDGFDFIRRLRSLPPEAGGEIPAAALTALARSDDRTRVLESGFQIHLPKPVEPLELVESVARLAASEP
jgi:PAS domain S-box-containing protein